MAAGRRTMTKYNPKLLDDNYCTALYYHFKYNIEWVDGVRSKKGFTRKARPINFNQDVNLDELINRTLSKLEISRVSILGIYLNYYRNGNDWTPNHSHPKQRQVVISLGAPRTLELGSKSYDMDNGDVIIFGSSIHGVPKQPDRTKGRISVALFLSK